MVAIGLINGNLTAEDYSDAVACNPQIDQLREKMVVIEDTQYSRDYHDPEKRSIANAIQVFYKNGNSSEKIAIEYPIGHRRRREEGIPLMHSKFKENAQTRYPQSRVEKLEYLFTNHEALLNITVPEFMELLVI